MDIKIQILDAKTFEIIYDEIINSNVNKLTLGVDLISNQSYSLFLLDTTKITKGNLLASSLSDQVFYIDKVYENKITYKSILELFSTDILVGNEVRLDVLWENQFKYNSDPLANLDNIFLITNAYVNLGDKELQVLDLKELMINQLYYWKYHLRTSIVDEKLYIYMDNRQENLFFNILYSDSFINISLPDLSNTYTTCKVYVNNTAYNYYLLSNNEITTNENDINRYPRVRTKVKLIVTDTPEEIDTEVIAREELVDIDDYVATVEILNQSNIIQNSNYYVGDAVTLNKEGRNLYSGTLTAIENNGTTTLFKIGFDREEFIFRKEF